MQYSERKPMIEITNEYVSMFDVDETLVLTDMMASGEVVNLKNPYDGSLQTRVIHHKHVELLKQMHGRGRMIGVWSGGGVQWAKEVIKALGLESHVDIVLTKPICYVDDLPSNLWLNNQIYLKP